MYILIYRDFLLQNLEELERKAMDHIQSQCPQVEWVHNFAMLGGCDYLDIFRAPDLDTAMKISAIIRSYGHASTEIWSAIEWEEFKDMAETSPAKKDNIQQSPQVPCYGLYHRGQVPVSIKKTLAAGFFRQSGSEALSASCAKSVRHPCRLP